ncbi:hypothetical protein LRS09_09330 [Mesorhizobium sp. J428]|nr:hypothetical protein [Mesorhizobium sp. J428]MCR5856955.1 hypothetical protein [Mesorhizobium sp. J428]
MLAQRGSKTFERRGGREKAAKDEGASPASISQAAKPSSKKLSYKQKFALENLPKKMEEAGAKIAALEARLADPALFSKDPAGFQKIAASLDAERAALHAMEEEWLELEMLREEIEG